MRLHKGGGEIPAAINLFWSFLDIHFDVFHIVSFLCNTGITILFSINIFLRFLRRLKYQTETPITLFQRQYWCAPYCRDKNWIEVTTERWKCGRLRSIISVVKRVQAGWSWIAHPGRGKRYVYKTSSLDEWLIHLSVQWVLQGGGEAAGSMTLTNYCWR